MPAFTWTPLDVLPRLPRPRRRWVTAGRAHIEVRSLPPEELAVFTDQVEAALAEHDAVLWAEVNPFVRRVVVAFEPERVSAQALVAIIEDVERVCEVHHRPFPRDAPEHPGDIEPLLRDGLSLGADLVGIGFGLFSRLVPVPSVVRADVGAFAKLLEGAPPLRRSLEHRVGAPITELALDVFGAVTQGLAFGPVGPMVDLAHRTVGLLEHRARGAAWSRREPELCAEPTGGLVPVTVEPRPVPVPPGPVETYTDRAWYGTVAAVAGSLALTRSMERAAAAVYAGAPRAAHFGRHAFAAQLSRVLAARGVVPLDPGALRLLDRADCVVVEGALLLNARHAVAQVHTLADVSDPEARRRAGLLLDPDRPDASVERDRWSLAPATEAAVDRARRVLSSTHDATGAGASYLALAHDGRPVALVETRPTLVPGAAELLDAVRRRGMRPLVVRHGADRLGVLGDVELVEPGPAATEAVRALQRDGHVVLAIAGRDLDLLAAADCSVGMCGPGHPTPWAADLLAGDDLADAFLVVEAAHAARAVSRQSVTIAGAGAAFGLLLAFGGRVPGSARRASAAVNVAAAATVLNGLRGGLRLARLPLRLDHDPTPWHALAPDAALAQLETSSVGLTGDQAARRRRPVARTAPLPLRFAGSVAGELVNPLTPVLAGGAVLSVLVGSFGDAMMVGTVMGVDALIGGVQRYRTDRAIERLGRRDGRTITARRDGSDLTVDAATVVPGDVIHVRAGDTVPADCRILEGAHLETDESSLTGESMPVRKGAEPVLAPVVAERSSMLYEGTSIAAGDATAVVVAVGSDTEARRSLAFLGGTPESGVEVRLHSLLTTAVPVSLLSGAGVVAVGMLRGRPLRDVLGAGVSLAVAAVPEGLPFLATVAQLGAARRLSRRGALVRNPRAIEALGRVDVVCADKTGTLTLGEIRLRLVSDGVTEAELDDLRATHRDTLAAALRAGPDPTGPARLPHPTDRACAEGARLAGVGESHGLEGWVRRKELPFEPARGYHATLGDAGPVSVLCLKGAPEIVLPRCSQVSHGGRAEPLDEAASTGLTEVVDRMGKRGLRVLAVAQREATARTSLHDRHVRDLTLLGFVALSDPVRPTAAAAVNDLRRAGIGVVMITGDHPSTAEGIGAELGLLEHGVVLTGTELDAMREDELDAMLARVAIFARVTPTHKVRIVRAFQRAGRAVAMTGDGANDAPAIRLADVGIALGERATTAARDAADLVVTDEQIETIVDAVIEGRAMWSSVRDAIAVLVGGNVGEVAFTLAGTLVTGAPPLNARQLLLVNLLTDAAPAMAIALRRPRHVSPETLLAEGPEASLGDALTRAILLRGATTAAGAGAAYVLARLTGRRARASTVGLVALTGAQFAQTLALGGRDPYVLAAGIGSTLLLAGIVQTPGVSQLFGCTPIGPVGWGIGIACAVGASAGAQLLPRLLPAAASVPRSPSA